MARHEKGSAWYLGAKHLFLLLCFYCTKLVLVHCTSRAINTAIERLAAETGSYFKIPRPVIQKAVQLYEIKVKVSEKNDIEQWCSQSVHAAKFTLQAFPLKPKKALHNPSGFDSIFSTVPANRNPTSMRSLRRIRVGQQFAFGEKAPTADEVLRLRRLLALGELGAVLAI